jgi:geranylgeranyl diphosphate synthase type I
MSLRAIPDSLDRARGVTEPALRWAVQTLAGEVRKPVEYHLGWVDADGKAIDGDTGKGVRPALAMLSAEAAGGSADDAVAGGVAVELVHNFSLLHDDVVDADTERRHRPTVWAIFGIGPAVIAGDALLSLAHEVLLRAGPFGAPASLCLAEATSEMIAGQADDMAFEARSFVSVEECVAMAGRKTGALLACASSIGAILAGADGATVTSLAKYGAHLGLAFQAIDDLLGIWGDPSRTGKPAFSDLRQRKKSLPVTAALSAGNGYSQRLSELLSSSELSDHEVSEAADLTEAAGGRELTVSLAAEHYERAMAALEHDGLVEQPRHELAELARFVLDRDF